MQCEPSTGAGRIGPCRVPWREGDNHGQWCYGNTIGASQSLFSVEGYSTALDLIINPNGNELQPFSVPTWAVQVWGLVVNQQALLLQENLVNGATPWTPVRYSVQQAVRCWDVRIVVIFGFGTFPFPTPGGSGAPIVSAIAHGREGGG
jgi:hypothetical protein